MKTLLQNPIVKITALVVVTTLLLVPQASQARMMMSDGTNQGGPGGGGEGDPLDSNDYVGGGGDDTVHERRIIPRDSDLVIYEIEAASHVIMLRVDIMDGVPIFSIYAVSASDLGAEASHVR